MVHAASTVSESTGSRFNGPWDRRHTTTFRPRRKYPPLSVFLNPSLELFAVELTLPTRVLLFGVRVVEQSGATLFREEFSHRAISADFHGAELVQLP